MTDQSITSSGCDSGYQSFVKTNLPIYKMDKDKTGIAVIISNENFQKNTKLSTRNGNDKDRANFKAIFKSLNFDVRVHDDQTRDQMKNIIKQVASENHSNFNCFALAIMSHGEQDFVHGVDARVELNELLEPLKANNCETLRGKPKLFFIQACRGNEFDEGVSYTPGYETDADESEPCFTKIPKEADYLYCYSCAYGNVSFRNQYGSWYVQTLHSVFDNYGKKYDILTLLTLVNNKIKELESNMKNKALSGMKQIPTFTSMLTKQLFFK